MAKLTWEIVRAIRMDHASGTPASILAERYKTCHENVCRIVSRRTWREP
jgi:hypothetical protein